MLPKRSEILPYAQLSRCIIAIKQQLQNNRFAVVVSKQRVQPTFSKKFIYFIYLFYLSVKTSYMYIRTLRTQQGYKTLTVACLKRTIRPASADRTARRQFQVVFPVITGSFPTNVIAFTRFEYGSDSWTNTRSNC